MPDTTLDEAATRRVIAHILNAHREQIGLAVDSLRDGYLTQYDFSTFNDVDKAWLDGALQAFASIGELLAVRV